MKIFLWASLPYTLAMVIMADTWKTRLWMPILIVLLLLKVRAAVFSSRPEPSPSFSYS